jgi:aromatic-amino-acid transaminase
MAFDHLEAQPADPLLSLIELFGSDPRRDKIDLSVGVYRDEQGRTPVFAAVKQAEALLVERQQSKSYLGPDGDRAYIALLQDLIFGNSGDAGGHAISGLQTPGGTGALRLAAELLALGRPDRRIWLGTPNWPNHGPIFRGAGLAVMTYPHCDPTGQAVDVERLFAAIADARPGDAVLLQICCHNPTGVDPDLDGWRAIAGRLAARGLIPLVDIAYHGLGDGFDADLSALRLVMAELPEALIAYSCDKNFGLYRDRVGALFFAGRTAEQARTVHSNLVAIARAAYSMPPDHGAAVVGMILADAALAADWRGELDHMRDRIRSVRAALAGLGRIGAIDLTPLARQKGMFALLPLPVATIRDLRTRHAIYMADSGRINIAGLQIDAIPRLADALAMVQLRAAA